MLLHQKVEPLLRELIHFAVMSGVGAGSTWGHYNRDQDLHPGYQPSDEEIWFGRDGYNQALARVFNVHEVEPDPSSIVVHPEIILSHSQKTGATLTIDNLHADLPSEPQTFSPSFKDGESEHSAVSASMKNEVWAKSSAEAKVEAGPASASASVESGWKNTIELAWNKQTGKTKEHTVAGSFPFRAGPHSLIVGQLVWDEQDKQRRIECDATLDFGFEFGRRRKRKSRWRWVSGSPARWDSIEHLIAVAEQRGSVHHRGYQHFGERPLNAEQHACLERIKQLRRIHVDRLSEVYKGTADIHIRIVQRDEADTDSDADD